MRLDRPTLPGATIAFLSTVAPLRTHAPIPTMLPGSRVHACTVALAPTTAPAPTTSGKSPLRSGHGGARGRSRFLLNRSAFPRSKDLLSHRCLCVLGRQSHELGDVQHCVVSHASASSDGDRVHVPSHHGASHHGGLWPDRHIPYHRGRRRQRGRALGSRRSPAEPYSCSGYWVGQVPRELVDRGERSLRGTARRPVRRGMAPREMCRTPIGRDGGRRSSERDPRCRRVFAKIPAPLPCYSMVGISAVRVAC